MQVLKTTVEADHVYRWIDTPCGDCGMQRFCASRSGFLTGCNANQEVNLSSRTAPGVVAGPLDYNPYNPISYAQNNTGNRGGGGR